MSVVGAGVAAVCSVRALSVRFPIRSGRALRAVDEVSLDVMPGESIGLVGESGSGKSVMALALLGLLGPAALVTGSVTMDGIDVQRASPRGLTRVRGRVAGLILQDPTASLNPVRSIRAQLLESARRVESAGDRAEAAVAEALRAVGLSPDDVLGRHPFQLSGGMNQRVALAMALVQRPRLLIADEPTTALDVSTQLGILGLLARIRDARHMSLLLISHDLAVVYQVAQRIGVMYAGKLVEIGHTAAVVGAPAHPYTRALVAAIPRLDSPGGRLATIPGQLRPRFDGDAGCPFRDRCALAVPLCAEAFPPSVEVEPGHHAACWAL